MCAPRLSKSLTKISDGMSATVADLDKLNTQNTLKDHQLLYEAAEQAVANFVSAQKSALNRVREFKPPAAKKTKPKSKKAKAKADADDSESEQG